MTARIGSLFSGAGGLDLAVEHVTGGRTVWHCEADPDAAKVLAAHWPGVPNLGDITAVDWSAVEPVDVLCGGFPCQDVSAAGRRAGIASGTRSGLWLEYAEAINQLRPRLVVIENVRGLLSGYAHRAMEPGPDDLGDRSSRPILRAAGAVLGDLADLGYDARWTTVAASDIGAPHRRERVFIVAYPAGKPWSLDQRDPRRTAADPDGDRWDQGRPESAGFIGGSDAALGGNAAHRVELLPTPAASRYPSNRSPSAGASVRPSLDSITDLLPTPSVADGTGGHLTRSGVRGDELLLPGVAKAYAEGALLPTPKATDAHSSSPADLNRNDPGLRAIDGLLPTPCASDATGGGAHPDSREGHSRQLIDYALLNGTPQWGKYAPAIRRWEAITREAPSPTEPGAKGNPRLAARFSEWMQGWPLGWVTAVSISRSAMLRIIGNGVVPQQAIAALYWLLSLCEVAA
ncbi:DNA cytosine methyltransferase [Mycobacteroides abscessus]|uniref:DNA cytosine methyltransferase n=1 Tax=Mycobacteroides abscessus TaxID=36809 RepID=UPI0007089B55|nr:DNA cytosine methyltransferase [Mycobacteroides abscessus]ALM17643.1 DNA methyltransferase [Mycobacteroides abscessus]AMU51756.1 DNA methyltransferase [Mycobacteroides abscessus]ANO10441.1 DNA (cytosine-5-)-methyltransferase [Mycobacteroides abscessus]MDM3919588.1 DNA cytosine methyltransferase [Mycobacteroides abscessus]MDO2963609.1 DNA cytosine methyltransferase [Mycobacteroides abscessus subsp. abscessus]